MAALLPVIEVAIDFDSLFHFIQKYIPRIPQDPREWHRRQFLSAVSEILPEMAELPESSKLLGVLLKVLIDGKIIDTLSIQITFLIPIR